MAFHLFPEKSIRFWKEEKTVGSASTSPSPDILRGGAFAKTTEREVEMTKGFKSNLHRHLGYAGSRQAKQGTCVRDPVGP